MTDNNQTNRPVSEHASNDERGNLIRVERTSGKVEYLSLEALTELNRYNQRRNTILRLTRQRDVAIWVAIFFAVITIGALFILPATNNGIVVEAQHTTGKQPDPKQPPDPYKTIEDRPTVSNIVVTQSSVTETPSHSLPVIKTKQLAGSKEQMQADILHIIQEWSEAWSGQDVDGYLGFYSENFNFQRQANSLSVWRKLRAERLQSPEWIVVRAVDHEFEQLDYHQAVINFHQYYQTSTYSDEVKKQLELTYDGSRWLITDERVIE